VECEGEGDTGNNSGDWNHLKITQTISEQHNRKARNEGTTETAILVTAHILQKQLM